MHTKQIGVEERNWYYTSQWGVKKFLHLLRGVQKVLAACKGGGSKKFDDKNFQLPSPPPKHLWTLPKPDSLTPRSQTAPSDFCYFSPDCKIFWWNFQTNLYVGIYLKPRYSWHWLDPTSVKTVFCFLLLICRHFFYSFVYHFTTITI